MEHDMTDVFERLHSMSKSLEGSGRLDEHEQPHAYGTVLDAMSALRRQEHEIERLRAELAYAHKDLELTEDGTADELHVLRAEIAKLRAAQQGEPVAWQERQARRLDKASGRITEWSGWYAFLDRTPDEPLSYTDPDDLIPREWRPLYAAPQQRQPLSDEQIIEIAVECGVVDENYWSEAEIEFARAVEAAHSIGITGEKQ